MADGNSDIRINITTPADTSGLDKAKEKLEEVKEEARAAGEEMKKAASEADGPGAETPSRRRAWHSDEEREALEDYRGRAAEARDTAREGREAMHGLGDGAAGAALRIGGVVAALTAVTAAAKAVAPQEIADEFDASMARIKSALGNLRDEISRSWVGEVGGAITEMVGEVMGGVADLLGGVNDVQKRFAEAQAQEIAELTKQAAANAKAAQQSIQADLDASADAMASFRRETQETNAELREQIGILTRTHAREDRADRATAARDRAALDADESIPESEKIRRRAAIDQETEDRQTGRQDAELNARADAALKQIADKERAAAEIIRRMNELQDEVPKAHGKEESAQIAKTFQSLAETLHAANQEKERLLEEVNQISLDREALRGEAEARRDTRRISTDAAAQRRAQAEADKAAREAAKEERGRIGEWKDTQTGDTVSTLRQMLRPGLGSTKKSASDLAHQLDSVLASMSDGASPAEMARLSQGIERLGQMFGRSSSTFVNQFRDLAAKLDRINAEADARLRALETSQPAQN